MAGRILPIALATIAGISIGVATFDREFKEQRRKKLEDEYKQEVAAASAKDNTAVSSLNSAGPSPSASSAIPAPSLEQIAARKADTKSSATSSSSWSSMLGLWAWNKNTKDGAALENGKHPKDVNGKLEP